MPLEKEIDLVRNGLNDSFTTVRVGNVDDTGASFAYGVSSGIGSGLNPGINGTAVYMSSLSFIQCISVTSGARIDSILPPSGASHVDGRHIRIYNNPVGATAGLFEFTHLASGAGSNSMGSTNGQRVLVCPYGYADLIYDSSYNAITSSGPGWRIF